MAVSRSKVMILIVATLLLLIGCTFPAYAEEENTVNQNQLPDSSFLYDVPISELFNAESFHDDQIVQVEGEVVGDRIADETSSDYCWITIQEMDVENPSVVNAYVSRDLVNQIDAWGHYGQQGSTVKIRGTFNLVCDTHQGQSDLHVDTLSVTAPGKKLTYTTSTMVTTLSWLSIMVAIGLVIFYQYRREQER